MPQSKRYKVNATKRILLLPYLFDGKIPCMSSKKAIDIASHHSYFSEFRQRTGIKYLIIFFDEIKAVLRNTELV